MGKYFDRTFFRFIGGFLLILLISAGLYLAVEHPVAQDSLQANPECEKTASC